MPAPKTIAMKVTDKHFSLWTEFMITLSPQTRKVSILNLPGTRKLDFCTAIGVFSAWKFQSIRLHYSFSYVCCEQSTCQSHANADHMPFMCSSCTCLPHVQHMPSTWKSHAGFRTALTVLLLHLSVRKMNINRGHFPHRLGLLLVAIPVLRRLRKALAVPRVKERRRAVERAGAVDTAAWSGERAAGTLAGWAGTLVKDDKMRLILGEVSVMLAQRTLHGCRVCNKGAVCSPASRWSEHYGGCVTVAGGWPPLCVIAAVTGIAQPSSSDHFRHSLWPQFAAEARRPWRASQPLEIATVWETGRTRAPRQAIFPLQSNSHSRLPNADVVDLAVRRGCAGQRRQLSRRKPRLDHRRRLAQTASAYASLWRQRSHWSGKVDDPDLSAHAFRFGFRLAAAETVGVCVLVDHTSTRWCWIASIRFVQWPTAVLVEVIHHLSRRHGSFLIAGRWSSCRQTCRPVPLKQKKSGGRPKWRTLTN